MTEAEWPACEESRSMLGFLRGRADDRKFRLFHVACCRRIWAHIPDDAHREAVGVAEQYADRQVNDRQRLAARARIAARPEPRSLVGRNACFAVFNALEKTVSRRIIFLSTAHIVGKVAKSAAKGKHRAYQQAYQAARAIEAQLVRCVFGNPFRAAVIEPEWKTSDAVAIARQMYDSREFGAMPILADALQDAGCDSDDILSHCRDDGPHVRGCWVVDLILEKE